MRLRTALTVLAATGLTLCTTGTASAADLDCADFPNQAAAQANLDANPSDPNGLDANDNGRACEDYAYAASSGAQVSTRPQGAVAAGDGSASEGPGVLPYAVGGLALLGAAGAGVAARRSARATA
ncbi:hypothetical protein [Klenkia brasiliensis]|uniref:Excalibur calcium-binding domain-containing protein n=1 Tax=Klenkia brasiliensis TaxID=333142 RepID=A0A1G8A231_9ACTN|nr:hypothetical protein [Klenkia brasiliensis]SDH14989.1 hypothetical protein SAMN05660324_0022 [Klenkia brasiliensis]